MNVIIYHMTKMCKYIYMYIKHKTTDGQTDRQTQRQTDKYLDKMMIIIYNIKV